MEPQPSILTTSATDGMLIRLFERHFDDRIAALLRLDKHLTTVELPFDLRKQLRELVFPPQPGLPEGLPSFIYYFVPNTGWGSDKPFPKDPVDDDFVYSSDGIGLNFGCPVRLLRALDALAELSSTDQEEPRAGLANSTKHLPTVEELLWLTAWNSPSELRRGSTLPGAKGRVDWTLEACSCLLHLEAKFRPSDWPRNTDQGTFVPIGGSFLAKAAHKFPIPPRDPALHLVAITAFENITKQLAHVIGQELEANPQIAARELPQAPLEHRWWWSGGVEGATG